MQFLKIDESTKFTELSRIVGSRNVDKILSINGLVRSPNIGKALADLQKSTKIASKNISTKSKLSMLNSVTSDSEVFEELSMLDEGDWRVYDELGSLPGALRIPDEVKLPESARIIGKADGGVSTAIYRKVVDSLTLTGKVDPAIFNKYSSAESSKFQGSNSRTDSDTFSGFNLPWGKIQLYSSLTGESMDIPAYPEELETSRTANYTTMPDTIYQYEPWQSFESSGPRQQSLTFELHRDMWTGDHRDGKANELIRFCESNCFARYQGSAVYTPTVRLYINGSTFISGIMTNVNVQWHGPLGLDDWYLGFKLSLDITEVSDIPLSYDSVRTLNIVGGVNK